MRTAIVSDLHLGAASGADLLARPAVAELLLEAIDGCERVVLLGDVLELRDRPLAQVMARARPFLAALGEAVGDGEIVLVPGNHDHHLVAAWLERRALERAEPLGIEERFEPSEGPLALIASQLGRGRTAAAYPGLWLAPGVYATHGHYLDRHLTVPTFERLGIAVVERLLGTEPLDPGGADPVEAVAPGSLDPAAPAPLDPAAPAALDPATPDPLDPATPDPLAPGPPHSPGPTSVEDYERVQAPVYALLYELAQAGGATAGTGGGPSVRAWRMLGGGGGRRSRLRGWLLGSVALPGAVGVANRLGLGPVRPDLSPAAIARASLLALAEVLERLGIAAEHVIFGHTHRRGPLGPEPGWSAGSTRLWNAGSWVHSPGLLGRGAAESPYWPGTVCLLDGPGVEPRLMHLLDHLTRSELAKLQELPTTS